MHPDSWRGGKGLRHCYPRLFMLPYHKPDNIQGIGQHELGQADTPADLCGRSKEGQGCWGRAATPLGDQEPG